MLPSRYRRIVIFYGRVIVSLVLWELFLPRVGFGRITKRTRSVRLRRIASRYRALANELGGVLIKVGQFLSARLDVLPEEITSELSELQDEVRAEEFADIRRGVEGELGPLEAVFAEFDDKPLAAASLGQVHRARLRAPSNGVQDIVVKVQRPNIEKIIATDLAALRTVTNWLNYYRPLSKRANLPALLSEFTRILEGELDYLAEGRNAETFAENFKNEATVRAPRVVWTHTTKRVLALEDVYAIKITDYAAITAAGVDRAEVAERLFATYLKQIFVDGFFHADPHPGNLFVSPRKSSRGPNPLPFPNREGETEGLGFPPRDDLRPLAGAENGTPWQLTFVDFGMVGRVTPNLRAGLRELAIAIATRDAARMVKGYQLLDVLLPGADLALLEKMESKILERFWGKTMSELRQVRLSEIQELASEFRGLIFTLPFQVPEDLILLGRTIAILSGMCTGLNPQFNFWDGLAPFAERLLAEEALSAWEILFDQVKVLTRALWSLPTRAEAALNKIERGEIEVRTPQLTEEVTRLELAVRRMMGGILFAALLFSGVQLHLAGEKILASTLLVAAGAVLVWMIRTRR